MATEAEKMAAGEVYDPRDKSLVDARLRSQQLCRRFNTAAPEDLGTRKQILKKLLGSMGKQVHIEPPFLCDYGSQIRVGSRVFFNFNCVLLDGGGVEIGDDFMCGPNVQFYTAQHPLLAEERRSFLETAATIRIGNDVWLGGGVILCPGVSIGDGAAIGAGSVVSKDIPAGVVAVGNPCRVLRKVGPEDRLGVLD